MRLSHLPLRVTTGAFLLNSGLSKRGLEGQAAEGMQGMAANAYPQLRAVQPRTFASTLSAGELALGAALLVPFVSPVVAGAGLTAYAGGLIKLYLDTPGLHEEGGVRPTPEGLGQAKDIWLLGAGLSLLMSGIADEARGAAKGARRSARKTRKAAAKSKKSAKQSAKQSTGSARSSVGSALPGH